MCISFRNLIIYTLGGVVLYQILKVLVVYMVFYNINCFANAHFYHKEVSILPDITILGQKIPFFPEKMTINKIYQELEYRGNFDT